MVKFDKSAIKRLLFFSIFAVQNLIYNLMQNLYTGALFMALTVYLIFSILLFLKRKDGERSRVLLGIILLLSVSNYTYRFIDSYDVKVQSIISPQMLILAIFMVLTYITYPIEVISPGWLNFKNILKIYSPVILIGCVYIITINLGIEYKEYQSPMEMFSDIGNFDVIFRLGMCFFILFSLALIFYIPHTKRYNNTDKSWINRYLAVSFLNIISYILVLLFTSIYIRTLYFFVSVFCIVYLVYQELFVRIIKFSDISETDLLENNNDNNRVKIDIKVDNQKNLDLFKRLDEFVNENKSWRDPDISMVALTNILKTNRTFLTEAIQGQGYENYAAYINRLRVKEFIDVVKNKNIYNFQDLFFDVGFRSKTSALRNFKNITGYTPSEYFQNLENNK